MVAIMVLGGLIMFNSVKYSGTPPFQDRKDETTKPPPTEAEETFPNLEPVGNGHPKYLRGWGDSWVLKA